MKHSPSQSVSSFRSLKNIGHCERGLTMLEMVLALSIMVIMISSMVSMANGDRQRADTLLGRIAEVNAGLQRFKHDFPCYPAKLSGLVIPSDAVASTCVTPNDQTKWKGPYLQPSVSILTATGGLELDNVQPGLSLQLTVDGPPRNNYVLELVGLTADLASMVQQQCGGKCNAMNADPSVATATDPFGLLVSPIETVTAVTDYEVVPVVADY